MTKKATKTANVTSMVSVEESSDYKRQRMKEVRSMIASAVRQGKRIDLMGFEGSDIARSQIALQDLLTKEQEKHERSRGHIMKLKNDNMCLTQTLDFGMTSMMIVLAEQAQEFEHLSKNLENAHDECYRLASGWQEAINNNHQLQTSVDGLRAGIKALT